jgi:hypothetical protein
LLKSMVSMLAGFAFLADGFVLMWSSVRDGKSRRL